MYLTKLVEGTVSKLLPGKYLDVYAGGESADHDDRGQPVQVWHFQLLRHRPSDAAGSRGSTSIFRTGGQGSEHIACDSRTRRDRVSCAAQYVHAANSRDLSCSLCGSRRKIQYHEADIQENHINIVRALFQRRCVQIETSVEAIHPR